MRNGRWLAPCRCSWPWPQSTNRTERTTCLKWKWASASIRAKWWQGISGSPERTKYGVVGSHVNLTSRIQSYTTGGQILISETTRREVGPILKIGKQMDVEAKGIEHPVTLCEVLGIEGPHRLFLPETTEALVPSG